jgi:hypothetical protein
MGPTFGSLGLITKKKIVVEQPIIPSISVLCMKKNSEVKMLQTASMPYVM